MRWITVGPPDQPDTSIVLHPPAANPGITDDERRTIAEMMAKGTYAGINLATHDLDEHLRAAPGRRRRGRPGADRPALRGSRLRVPRSRRQPDPDPAALSRLRAAERLVRRRSSPAPARRRPPGPGRSSNGLGEDVEQALERLEVARGRGGQRLLHEVVARDVDRVDAVHRGGDRVAGRTLVRELLAPALRPRVERGRREERPAAPRRRAATPTAPGSSRCSRRACSCSSAEQVVDQRVGRVAGLASARASRASRRSSTRWKRSGNVCSSARRRRDRRVGVVVDQRQQRLGEPRQVPRRDRAAGCRTRSGRRDRSS